MRYFVIVILLVVLIWPSSSRAGELPEPATKEVDFKQDIEPILSKRCHSCHGANKAEGGLRLHKKADALAGGDSGPAIMIGQSAESRLIRYVAGLEDEKRMPPEGDTLSDEQIGLLRAWIDQGAKWSENSNSHRAADHAVFPLPSSSMHETRPWPIFVYGTLKSSESRASAWPLPAISVEPAVVRGTLFDLGDYPALGPGDRLVLGELWRLADEHLAPTLRVLDVIEGFSDSDDDLFKRTTIECMTQDGNRQEAMVYLFHQQARLAEARLMEAGFDGYCVWTSARGVQSPSRSS